jgi:prepilin-type N-terminal cleavage/methylation domain-containing protein/prepilin-type processing-associated H-X9-DG protein
MTERGDGEARECFSAASRADGFTFTELLVVVSLGAILVGTILPALNTAQDTMKAAVCLGNMHQWGLAISLYCADQKDYYPYVGDSSSPCDTADTWAWYNVVPPYINQTKLCDLYTANTPPTPGTKSIWICPSATNVTVNPSSSSPYFCYSLSVCTHLSGETHNIFRRSQMVKPATTIIFCEEPEDNFSETSGRYDTVQRHFGGSNFVMGDGHAEWIAFGNFCRLGNPGCPAPLGDIQWNDSSSAGDWDFQITYHWWFFPGAAVSSN